MRNSVKLGLTALLAAMLLASALSTASARNLSVSNQGFLVSWSRLEFQSNLVTIRCQVTLDGSFHSRTIPKVARLLIGAISEARVKTESCEGGGTASIINSTLPWHVTYESFTGSLPAIATVRVLLARFQFRITAIGVNCIIGTPTDNVTGAAILNGTGEVTNIQPVNGLNTANLQEGGGFCPRSGTLVAAATDGRVNVLNAWTTRITIRLI